MTSATDNRTTELHKLCEMLDEHGIEWTKGDASYQVEWTNPNGQHCSAMWWKPMLTVLMSGCTPEQAIAATLGNTTCEYVIEDNMNESEGMGDVWFRCTNCDTCYDYQADDWLMKMPHCPKCGATVKGVR